MSVVGLVIALLACLAVQAFFAASEIALVSADDLKVRAESEGGHQRSRMLDQLLLNRDRLLALPSDVRERYDVTSMKALGHTVEIWPERKYLAGSVVTIQADLATGIKWAGADPRRTAYAVGW